MQDFRSLKVWQKSHRLVLEVYRATRSFPQDELYGLTSQMRRCGVSVPANIAEGCGRGGSADFARFLRIAMGSASELEYHFQLSNDLGFLSEEMYGRLSENVMEVKRMLTSFVQRLKSNEGESTSSD